MRNYFVCACIAGLASLALAQGPALPSKPADSGQASGVSADSGLKDMFEAKIKTEWEALKNKDKKVMPNCWPTIIRASTSMARANGIRFKSVNELAGENVFNYTLWGYKLVSLWPDAALVIYESTMQFPPQAQIRYSRVYISEIWVKRAGQWKELHYQETRVK